MISAFSASSQAYFSLAGLLKVLDFFYSGDNKNVIPPFVGPSVKMFLNLPLPLVSTFLMPTAKSAGSTLFP